MLTSYFLLNFLLNFHFLFIFYYCSFSLCPLALIFQENFLFLIYSYFFYFFSNLTGVFFDFFFDFTSYARWPSLNVTNNQWTHFFTKFFFSLFFLFSQTFVVFFFEKLGYFRIFIASLLKNNIFLFFIFLVTGSYWSWSNVDWSSWWFGEDLEELLLLLLLFIYFYFFHFKNYKYFVNFYTFLYIFVFFKILVFFLKSNHLASRHLNLLFYVDFFSMPFLYFILFYRFFSKYFWSLRAFFLFSMPIFFFSVWFVFTVRFVFTSKFWVPKIRQFIFLFPVSTLLIFPLCCSISLFTNFIFLPVFKLGFLDITYLWFLFFPKLINFFNFFMEFSYISDYLFNFIYVLSTLLHLFVFIILTSPTNIQFFIPNLLHFVIGILLYPILFANFVFFEGGNLLVEPVIYNELLIFLRGNYWLLSSATDNFLTLLLFCYVLLALVGYGVLSRKM